jgi:5,10-methylenetetrahydromethanopterin reductase
MSKRPALSCALPPDVRIPEYAKIAERLGYERLWLFDSPAIYGDIWVSAARAAEATERLGVGTGVAIPSLRHPMVTASAIATIEEIAPGRLIPAFGTGFTGRSTMGQKGGKWADLALYLKQLRALLAGETVVVEGQKCRMMHGDMHAPKRPINVPLWAAPSGPKGFAISREVADGILVPFLPEGANRDGWSGIGLLTMGTVVRPGEDHTSQRLIEAAGPAYTTGFHAMWEMGPSIVESMPGGPEWLERINAEKPEGERHTIVHEGHLAYTSDRDRLLVAVAGEGILNVGWTGGAASIVAKAEGAAAHGVTEILYTPCGPDIPGELEAFAAALK